MAEANCTDPRHTGDCHFWSFQCTYSRVVPDGGANRCTSVYEPCVNYFGDSFGGNGLDVCGTGNRLYNCNSAGSYSLIADCDTYDGYYQTCNWQTNTLVSETRDYSCAHDHGYNGNDHCSYSYSGRVVHDCNDDDGNYCVDADTVETRNYGCNTKISSDSCTYSVTSTTDCTNTCHADGDGTYSDKEASCSAGACDAYSACNAGYACNGAGSKADGNDCATACASDDDDYCANDYTCFAGACIADGSVAEFGTCDQDEQCDNSVYDHVCSNNECLRITGEACTTGDDCGTGVCISNSTTTGGSGTCQTPDVTYNGNLCSDNNNSFDIVGIIAQNATDSTWNCASNEIAYYSSNYYDSCSYSVVVNGSDCEQDISGEFVSAGYTCLGTQCIAPNSILAGQSCAIDLQCISNNCIGNICIGNSGETCSVNSDCETEFCYNNVCVVPQREYYEEACEAPDGIDAQTQGTWLSSGPVMSKSLGSEYGGMARSISSHALNTCVVLNDGSVDCWGADFFRIVSDAYSGNNAVAVSVGYYSACALLNDGSVDCWGNNTYNLVSDAYSGSNAVGVFSNYYHSCVILNDGSAECWGDSEETDFPNNVVDIDVGDHGRSVVLYANGNINRTHGGDTFMYYPSVIAKIHAVDILSVLSNGSGAYGYEQYPSVVDAETREPYICFIKTDGSLDCPQIFGSYPIYNGIGVSDLALGATDGCALLNNGSVSCWGWDLYGISSNAYNGSSAVALTMGNDYACAIIDDGSVSCWGYDGVYGFIRNSYSGTNAVTSTGFCCGNTPGETVVNGTCIYS